MSSLCFAAPPCTNCCPKATKTSLSVVVYIGVNCHDRNWISEEDSLSACKAVGTATYNCSISYQSEEDISPLSPLANSGTKSRRTNARQSCPAAAFAIQPNKPEPTVVPVIAILLRHCRCWGWIRSHLRESCSGYMKCESNYLKSRNRSMT